MSNKNQYELVEGNDSEYQLSCLYGEPGEYLNPPAGGLTKEPFTGYVRYEPDEDGYEYITVAHYFTKDFKLGA